MIQQIQTFCEKVASLGKGYNECIYQEALCSELRKHNIQYSKEQVIPILYDGHIVVGNMRMDIVLPYEKIIIEMKAIDGELKECHIPQIITYLKATEYNYGLYINYIQNPTKPLYEIYTVEKQDAEKYFCTNILIPQKTFWFDSNGCKIVEQENSVNV